MRMAPSSPLPHSSSCACNRAGLAKFPPGKVPGTRPVTQETHLRLLGCPAMHRPGQDPYSECAIMATKAATAEDAVAQMVLGISRLSQARNWFPRAGSGERRGDQVRDRGTRRVSLSARRPPGPRLPEDLGPDARLLRNALAVAVAGAGRSREATAGGLQSPARPVRMSTRERWVGCRRR